MFNAYLYRRVYSTQTWFSLMIHIPRWNTNVNRKRERSFCVCVDGGCLRTTTVAILSSRIMRRSITRTRQYTLRKIIILGRSSRDGNDNYEASQFFAFWSLQLMVSVVQLTLLNHGKRMLSENNNTMQLMKLLQTAKKSLKSVCDFKVRPMYYFQQIPCYD